MVYFRLIASHLYGRIWRAFCGKAAEHTSGIGTLSYFPVVSYQQEALFPAEDERRFSDIGDPGPCPESVRICPV